MSSLPILDIIVIVVILLSALLAMVRGFTREVLSITAWVVAAAAGYYFRDLLVPFIGDYVNFGPDWLPTAISGVIVFIVTLILVSLITIKIADLVLDSMVGPVDRSLGFVFGGLRGFLLMAVAYLFFTNFVAEQQRPVWVAEAKTLPALEATSEGIRQIFVDLIPEDPEGTFFDFMRRRPGENEPIVVPDGEAPAPANEPVPPAGAPSGTL